MPPSPYEERPSPSLEGESRMSSGRGAGDGGRGLVGRRTSTCRPPASVVRAGPAALLRPERNWDVPQGPHEKSITEKYRIWRKGGEAERAPAPLSLSPPAGSRGLWEGRAEVASAKVPPAGRCRLPELGETHTCPPPVGHSRVLVRVLVRPDGLSET